MNISGILIAACALPPLAAAGPAATSYSLMLEPANTRIEWTLGDVLHTVRGTFQLDHGSLQFNPESGVASGEIVVNTATGESGNGRRDRRMHSAVLESPRYPDAVFWPDHIAGRFAPEGSSDVMLHGTLHLHGATHEMILNVRSEVSGGRMTADITFDVPYLAWGLKDPSTFVLRAGKVVKMSAHVTVRLQKEPSGEPPGR